MESLKESEYQVDCGRSKMPLTLTIYANENGIQDIIFTSGQEEFGFPDKSYSEENMVKDEFPFGQNCQIFKFQYQPSSNGIVHLMIYFKNDLDEVKTYSYQVEDHVSGQSISSLGSEPAQRLTILQEEGKVISTLKFKRKGNIMESISATFTDENSMQVNLKQIAVKDDTTSKQVLTSLSNNAKDFTEHFLSLLKLQTIGPSDTNKNVSDFYKTQYEKIKEYIDKVILQKSKYQQLMAKAGRVIEAQIWPVLDSISRRIKQNMDKNQKFKKYKPSDYTKNIKDLLEFQTILDGMIKSLEAIELDLGNLKNDNFIPSLQQKFRRDDHFQLIKIRNNDNTDIRQLIIERDQYEVELLRLENEKLNDDKASEEFQLNLNIRKQTVQDYQEMLNKILEKERDFSEKIITKRLDQFNLPDSKDVIDKIKKVEEEKEKVNIKLYEAFQKEQTRISVEISKLQSNYGLQQGSKKLQIFHIILLLDESGSMSSLWPQVIEKVNMFIKMFKNVELKHLISIVTYDNKAQIIEMKKQAQDIGSLPQIPNGGGTNFCPALQEAIHLVDLTPSSYTPIIVMMTDGNAWEEWPEIESKAQLLKNQGKSKDLMYFNIGFGHNYEEITLRKLAKTINGTEGTKFRNQDVVFSFDARDSVALQETFTNIADALLSNSNDQLIQELSKQNDSIKLKFEEDKYFINEHYQKQIENLKSQAKILSKIVEKDNQKNVNALKNALTEQVALIRKQLEQAQADRDNFIKEHTPTINEIEKPYQYAKERLVESIRLNKENEKNQLTLLEASKIELEEEMQKLQNEAGFYAIEQMYKFSSFLESPQAVINTLQISINNTLSFLQKTQTIIRMFEDLLSQSETQLDNETITEKMYIKYCDPDQPKNDRSSGKIILKKVLQTVLEKEFTGLLELIFDDLYEHRDFNIQNFVEMKKEDMGRFIKSYVKAVSPDDTKEPENKKQDESSSSSDDDEETQKKSQKKSKNQPQSTFEEGSQFNDYDYYIQIETKTRFDTVQETIKLINGLEYAQNFANTKIREIKKKRKALTTSGVTDKQQKQEIKDSKEKMKQQIEKYNNDVVNLENKIKFYNATLKPKILEKNITKLINSISCNASNCVQEAILENFNSELGNSMQQVWLALQCLPIFNRLTIVFTLSTQKEFQSIKADIDASGECLKMIRN